VPPGITEPSGTVLVVVLVVLVLVLVVLDGGVVVGEVVVVDGATVLDVVGELVLGEIVFAGLVVGAPLVGDAAVLDVIGFSAPLVGIVDEVEQSTAADALLASPTTRAPRARAPTRAIDSAADAP
jgi:hypothetical protein